MTTYTVIHVVISLVGIGSGVVVLFGMLTGQRLDRWTALFLASFAGAGVRAAATGSAVTQPVSGSTSQKTGRAPVGGIASALA